MSFLGAILLDLQGLEALLCHSYMYANGPAWLIFIATLMLALLPDFLWESLKTNVLYDPLRLQMYHERSAGLPDLGVENFQKSKLLNSQMLEHEF